MQESAFMSVFAGTLLGLVFALVAAHGSWNNTAKDVQGTIWLLIIGQNVLLIGYWLSQHLRVGFG